MSEVWTDVTVCFADTPTTTRWADALTLARSEDWPSAREALSALGMACVRHLPDNAIRVSRLLHLQRRLEFRFIELGLDSKDFLDTLVDLGATHLNASSDDSRTGSVTRITRIGRDKVKEAQFIAAVSEFDDNYAFRHAVIKGKLTEIKRLLKQGVSVNEPIQGKGFPIHYATANNKPKIVKALIDANADLNVQTGKGRYEFSSFRTPLHIALSDPIAQEIAMMLIDAGADLSLTDGKGCTPLHLAIQAMHIPLCRAMLARGANPNPNPCDAEGRPALFELSSLKAEAIPEFLTFAHEAGLALDMSSKQHGNLRWALGWMRPAADFLDARGFQVVPSQQAYDGKPANVLQAAIRHHDHVKINQLIDQHVDLNALPDPPEKSPHQSVEPALSTAARWGATRIVQRLLDAGCDPNTPGSDGRCALHYAAMEGSEEITRLLLQTGADANAIIAGRGSVFDGRQPNDDAMLLAIDQKHFGIAELLLPNWRPNAARLQRGKDNLRMLIDHKYVDAASGAAFLAELEVLPETAVDGPFRQPVLSK